jgi:hypothetical protein
MKQFKKINYSIKRRKMACMKFEVIVDHCNMKSESACVLCGNANGSASFLWNEELYYYQSFPYVL